MAITEITPTQISLDTGVVVTAAAGTAIDTGNTIEILYPKQGKLLIKLQAVGATATATLSVGYGVAGGANSMSCTTGVSKLFVISSDKSVIAVGDGATPFYGCLQITWVAASAGFIQAFYLP